MPSMRRRDVLALLGGRGGGLTGQFGSRTHQSEARRRMRSSWSIENFERPVSSSEITSQFAQHGADDVGIVVGPNTLVRVAFAD